MSEPNRESALPIGTPQEVLERLRNLFPDLECGKEELESCILAPQSHTGELSFTITEDGFVSMLQLSYFEPDMAKTIADAMKLTVFDPQQGEFINPTLLDSLSPDESFD